jgi:hypothetical protein
MRDNFWCARRVRREGAANNARGGRAPQTSSSQIPSLFLRQLRVLRVLRATALFLKDDDDDDDEEYDNEQD